MDLQLHPLHYENWFAGILTYRGLTQPPSTLKTGKVYESMSLATVPSEESNAVSCPGERTAVPAVEDVAYVAFAEEDNMPAPPRSISTEAREHIRYRPTTKIY